MGLMGKAARLIISSQGLMQVPEMRTFVEH